MREKSCLCFFRVPSRLDAGSAAQFLSPRCRRVVRVRVRAMQWEGRVERESSVKREEEEGEAE